MKSSPSRAPARLEADPGPRAPLHHDTQSEWGCGGLTSERGRAKVWAVELEQSANAGRQSDEQSRDLTPRERQLSGLRPFKPGQSGNPSGRPRGSSPRQAAMKLLAAHADAEGDGALSLKLGRGYVRAVEMLTERMADPNASPSALASYGKALESLTRALAELDPAPKVTERRETSQRVVLSLSGQLPAQASGQLPIMPLMLHDGEQAGSCEVDSGPRTVELERGGGEPSETGMGPIRDAPLPLRSTPPPSPPTP